ncbi:hypothetical protein HNQ51_002035 [Inhella inkyongensis]|uniref:Ice-binding protein C-terminal domain-containing protein n=1 Tax=Inhella inkyongensis TaxID=392593 RepID=A0A840S844_9BURK|nr:PEP-CTERM sorting domain-containing protein [Inhella inkyongensis]MBB5204721.1 hypothetical protein [Inhella inkyongensis]
MFKPQRILAAAALAVAASGQAAPITYTFTALGTGAAAGGTLTGTLVIGAGATDSDASPTRGAYESGVTMSGSVSGGVQDGMSYMNESKRLMVDADSDDIFSFINLSDTWPVFQLFFSAAFGADPLKDDKPHIYLDDFAARHEIRFQMPGAKQYSYDISSWASSSLPPRDPHAVPLPGSMALAGLGLLGLAWAQGRRRGASLRA